MRLLHLGKLHKQLIPAAPFPGSAAGNVEL